MNNSVKVVFVTGATGLLGSNTVAALLAKQYHVKALVRSAAKAAKVLPADPRIEVIVGDLDRPEAWYQHLDGCEAVIHTAAYFREYFGRGDHAATLEASNVAFPVALAKESASRRVKRIVMVSSTGVLSGRADRARSAEGDPANVQIPGNGYQESKRRMEKALLSLELGSAELVIARPGWMWGPGDFAPTATGQIALDMLKQKSFQFVDGLPFGIVDARDVAFGLAQIVDVEHPSKIYHLAGNNMTALQAINAIARKIGTVKVQVIPYCMAMILSSVLEFGTRIIGARNPLPREGIEVICKGVLVDSSLAQKELGVTFRPFESTAADMVTFVKAHLAP